MTLGAGEGATGNGDAAGVHCVPQPMQNLALARKGLPQCVQGTPASHNTQGRQSVTETRAQGAT